MAAMTVSEAPRSRTSGFLTWFFCALPLLGFWLYGLFDLDEGFYASVAGDMLRRGEWLTPTLNGSPWFEKPILIYWLAKPSILVFGQVIGPRLPSVLCSLLLYGVVGAFVRRRAGHAAAQISMLILATSLLMVGVGRMMMTDAPMVLCLTTGLLAFFESLLGDIRWRWLAGFALGLSVLAKGPIGCVVFCLIGAWTFWREPDLRSSFRGSWSVGIALFVLTVASWYLPAYAANGKLFVEEFLIKQNLERFTGGDSAHSVGGLLGLVFYLAVLVAGMLPWIFWLPGSWRMEGSDDESRFRRFLASWAVIVFLFFTLSSAKLPHYILPTVPALAVLIGLRVAASAQRVRLVWLPGAIASVAACVIVNLGFIVYYNGTHREIHDLASLVRNQGGSVVAYQMSRRTASQETRTANLQETSHPSISFYVNRPVLDIEDLNILTKFHRPIWIITRPNRLSLADLAAFHLEPVSTPKPPRQYALFVIR